MLNIDDVIVGDDESVLAGIPDDEPRSAAVPAQHFHIDEDCRRFELGNFFGG